MSRDTRGQQYVFRNVQDRDECFNLIKTYAELAKASNTTTGYAEVPAFIHQILQCYIRYCNAIYDIYALIIATLCD
jgi:hypothetical protein